MRNKRDRPGDTDTRCLNYRPFVQARIAGARGSSPAGLHNLSVASRRHFRCSTTRVDPQVAIRPLSFVLLDVVPSHSIAGTAIGSAVDPPRRVSPRALHYPGRAITRINDRRLVIRADEIPAITTSAESVSRIADIGIDEPRLESTPIV